MKSVLISIQPKWCKLIANGSKTIEIRKTKPKLETPFKVYIYCTKSKKHFLQSRSNMFFYCEDKDFIGGHGAGAYQRLNGKVIGEFVCDCIEDFKEFKYDIDVLHRHIKLNACINYREIYNYLGFKKCGYGWHISNLVIYDKPRGLYEFYRKCEKMPCEGCEHLKYQGVNSTEYDYDCEFFGNRIPITRPPQSWCYVENEVEGE